MPTFGAASKAQLATCEPDLVRVAEAVIPYFDFSVLEGHRGEEAQNRAYARKFSKVRWPDGAHNRSPSRAFDIAPYPVDWGPPGNSPEAVAARRRCEERFILLAGFMLLAAAQLGIGLRWGGDWDQDQDTRDEGSFRDWGHFELAD